MANNDGTTYAELVKANPDSNMRIVSIVAHAGGYIIATEYNVFMLKDGHLEDLRFRADKESFENTNARC